MALGATIKVKMDTSAVRRGLDKVRGNLKKWGVGVAKTFAALGAGVGAAGGFLAALTINANKYVKDLRAMSAQTSLSVRQVLRLRHAFDLANVGIEDSADLISDFQERIEDARRGAGTGREGYKELGMHLSEIYGADLQTQITTVFNKINALNKTTGQRADILDKIFGSQGFALVELSKNYAEFMSQAAEDTAAIAADLGPKDLKEFAQIDRTILNLKLLLRQGQIALVKMLPLERIRKFIGTIIKEAKLFIDDPIARFEVFWKWIKKQVKELAAEIIEMIKKESPGIKSGMGKAMQFLSPAGGVQKKLIDKMIPGIIEIIRGKKDIEIEGKPGAMLRALEESNRILANIERKEGAAFS